MWVFMQEKKARDWKELRWGTVVSVGLHVVLGIVLLFQLPMPDFTPPEEETVSVEMVPPPPEEAEEEQAEEEQAEEQPPPPPPEQAQQEQAAAEQPPAEIPIPVLRPVYEFGEKDTGSSRALEGNASEDKPELQPEKPIEEAEAKPPEPEKTEEAEAKPETEALAEMAEAIPAESPEPEPEVAEEKPKEEAAKPEEIDEDIPEVKKLFSEEASDNPIALTAMGNLPRSERIARLCSSELYAQLKNGSPAYNAELVPSYTLPNGNLLKVQRAAFRAKNRWYDLSFRCEVDAEGTRIHSFGFDVGAEVPKSQWRRRGFPSS